MGPAIPFTYDAGSLATANGLHAETPAVQRVSAGRPRREARHTKRMRLALWHRPGRDLPVAGC